MAVIGTTIGEAVAFLGTRVDFEFAEDAAEAKKALAELAEKIKKTKAPITSISAVPEVNEAGDTVLISVVATTDTERFFGNFYVAGTMRA
jgi:hypothetical protein